MRLILSLSVAVLCASGWVQEKPGVTPPAWRITKENFTAPQGATPPRLVKSQYATSFQPGSSHTASLSFEISEKGIPFNIRVENSSDPETDDEVTALIREWRFEAAMRDGFPVPSSGLLELSIGDGRLAPRLKK